MIDIYYFQSRAIFSVFESRSGRNTSPYLRHSLEHRGNLKISRYIVLPNVHLNKITVLLLICDGEQCPAITLSNDKRDKLILTYIIYNIDDQLFIHSRPASAIWKEEIDKLLVVSIYNKQIIWPMYRSF